MQEFSFVLEEESIGQLCNKPEMPWEALSCRARLERKIIHLKEARNTGATQSETTGV